MFLICGTIRGDVPYPKVKEVREKNRKIGLGLMGMHEWLLKRGYTYEVTPELHKWMEVYRDESERAAREHCDRFYLSHPKKFRAIAPAGTIGILASTTTGIEPLFAVAYKRRYLEGGTKWKYQYVIDATAERIISETGVDPDSIETAQSLVNDPEKRIKFQADIQDYVDMSISSTINLPEWGTKYNNEDTARKLADTLATYCTRLRGITVYPDGSRGGQPITPVPYETAHSKRGVIFDETEERCQGGVCGI
jgi:ribonucleoside-diphosphate reductase alpha chain